MIKSRMGSTDASFPRTFLAYDAYGNVTAIQDAEGRQSHTEYDAYFLYPYIGRNALGHQTVTVMDYRWGKPVSVTDPNGAVTTYAYDEAGRLTCVKQPLAAVPCSTAYAYTYATQAGDLTRVDVDQDEANHPSGYLRTAGLFDALGRHRETHTLRVVNGSGETVVADKMEYDGGGRLAKRYEAYLASGAPTAFTAYDYHLNGGIVIDPLGRVSQTTAPNGTTRRMLYQGTIRSVVDEAGVETRRVLDAHGNVVHEEIWRPGDASANAIIDASYDGGGRLLTTMQNGNAATTITHSYDELGRRTQTVDPDSGTWRYVYDKVGNLIAQDDPKANQHRQLCYDGLNRVTLDCPFDSDYGGFSVQGVCHLPCDAAEVRYTYDQASVANAKGRLTTVTDASGTTEFQGYDRRGRALKVQKTIDVDGVISAGTTYYEYDSADRVRKTRYPDGEWVETQYDASGQPLRLVNNGGLTYIGDVRYDLFGRPMSIRHGNFTEDTRSYDTAPSAGNYNYRQLATLTSRVTGTGSYFLNLSYQDYTARGLIGRVVDHRNPSGVLSHAATYTYDALGRLTQLTNMGASGVESAYAHDAYGNLTQKGARYIDYHPSQPHQPSGVRIGSPAAPPTPVAHDANGNRLDTTAGSPDYLYDAWNRLIQITVPGGPVVQFVYDYSGRRVAKVVGTEVTRYYSELAEVTSDDQLFKSYYLGGVRVASQQKPCASCELAHGPRPPAVRLAAVSLQRPALVLLVRRDVQVVVAAGLTVLGVGLLVSPWRRRRRATITGRPGRVILFVLVFGLNTCPWPMLLQRADAQGCGGPPTPTPVPTATATPVAAGTVRHYHVDHLGSTHAVTDAGGVLLEQLRYQPYGQIRGRWDWQDPPQPINPGPDYRFEFSTYETEWYSQLQYAGARFFLRLRSAIRPRRFPSRRIRLQRSVVNGLFRGCLQSRGWACCAGSACAVSSSTVRAETMAACGERDACEGSGWGGPVHRPGQLPDSPELVRASLRSSGNGPTAGGHAICRGNPGCGSERASVLQFPRANARVQCFQRRHQVPLSRGISYDVTTSPMTNRETEPPSSEVTHMWASIFSSRPIEDGPFRNSDWEVFLVPHQLLMQEDDFRRLQASADLVGDKDFIVLSDDLQLRVVINWDYGSLVGLAGHAVAVNDAYVFAKSAAWGMVCTHDDFSLLGGVPAFMDKYASEAGGRERLREAFLNWIRPPGWLVPTHITQKLLALAGWGD